MTLYDYTIESLAKELGICPKTLSTRLNSSPEKFTQAQILKLVKILKIENPIDIFFNQ